MPDAFSTAMSTYAVLEADEARQAAERAEMQAFVNGYSHHGATPAERQRYVESVRVLYPQPASEPKPMTALEKQVLGGIIVAVFAWFAAGAVFGKCRYDDVGEGIAAAGATLMVGLVGGFVLAILATGVYLLMGHG